ncbi:MAG: hypothetical protein U0T73_07280 [Chitinophagales bacterium]
MQKFLFKNRFAVLIFLTLGVALNSCKKETAKVSIDGIWMQLSYNSLQPTGSYYNFNTSEKKVYLLERHDYEMHEVTDGVLRLRDNLAEIDLGSLQLYQYSMHGDTLIMDNGTASEKLVLIKNNLGPKSNEDWVKEVSISIAFRDSTRLNSLMYHNNALFGFSPYAPALNKFSLSSKSKEAVVTLAEVYTTGEFDYNNLWGCPESGSKLQKVDHVNGAVLNTSAAAPFYRVEGLTFNGVLLLGCNGYNTYRYNPSSNTFSQYDGPSSLEDLAFYDNKVYGVSYGTIYRFNPSNFTVEKAYRIPNFKVDGIAFDGTQFWIHGTERGAITFAFGTVSLN